MKEMSISMIGGIPMIDVKIWNRIKNVYNVAALTLDTGAATTTISHDIIHLLGYETQSKPKKRIITASGIEYADEVTLDKIQIAGFELINIDIYAHTFPRESFSKGVIGVNTLLGFDLFISFHKKILKLIPISNY